MGRQRSDEGVAGGARRPTRKNSPLIKVRVLPEEKAAIEANAKAAGMSASKFLREVGQGYVIRGITDYERVRELAVMNGDLGRLGGLLKWWLSDDPQLTMRARQSLRRIGHETVRRLLGRIDRTQDEMAAVMEKIMRAARAA